MTPNDGGTATPKPAPAKPRVKSPARMSDIELEDALDAANTHGDWDRLEKLGDEMDRREHSMAAALAEVEGRRVTPADVAKADDMLVQKYIDKIERYNANLGKSITELREEYDAWSHSQFLSAENATRGVLFNNRFRDDPKAPNSAGFFDGSLTPAQIRKYASEELLRWFANNPRLSFDEWRAQTGNTKSARDAKDRVRGRTMSEFG